MKPRWGLGLGIGLVTGLCLWILSGPPFEVRPEMPLFLWFWAPVVMTGILIYADWIRGEKPRRWWKITGAVGVLALYAVLVPQGLNPVANRQFENLMMLHLPLLAWVGVGGYLLGLKSGAQDRTAFLVKSLELMVMAGLLMAVGGVFMGTTRMLFNTMKLVIPEAIIRFGVCVGLGLGSPTVVMIGYNPNLKPREQSFKTGIYPILALATRLFIPLVLFVLIVYVAIIPFNFWIPFKEREALVTFNAVLMAVMVLLIGATPLSRESLSDKWLSWLRGGMIAIAVLSIVINLYALAAAIYRTYIDQWTVNRVVIVGWNLINMTVLGGLVWGQIRAGKGWIEKIQINWGRAMLVWAIWVVAVIVILPWFFGIF